jgi:hypothetical protein
MKMSCLEASLTNFIYKNLLFTLQNNLRISFRVIF